MSFVVVKLLKGTKKQPEVLWGQFTSTEATQVTNWLMKDSLDQLFLSLEAGSHATYLRGVGTSNESASPTLGWDPAELLVFNDHTVHQNDQSVTHYPQDTFWSLVPERADKLARQVIEQIGDNQSAEFVLRFWGWYGYLSYELGRELENHTHRKDPPAIPLAVLFLPSRVVVDLGSEWLYFRCGDPIPNLLIQAEVNLPAPPRDEVPSSTSYPAYIRNVERVIDYIRAGDIYQANYTQRFVLPNPKMGGKQAFIDLCLSHPVPHASYVNCGSFEILSLSPELFLSVEDGRVVTKPIKGTRPRGKTTIEDEKLTKELLSSPKDHSELSMIVDLLRNDLGRSCIPGTVKVKSHAALESYSNVHHLVSTITARVHANILSSWRLLLRSFPGGSITGCPKIRAMEIIEELEASPRGVYTGTVGSLAVGGNLRLNVAIRTILLTATHVIANAGGGIVVGSDPVEEYLESLHKAKHIIHFFGGRLVGHLVWVNGQVLNYDQARVPVTTSAFQYGEGCFETVLIQDGSPVDLHTHLNRLRRGMTYYHLPEDHLPSEKDIREFLRLNLASHARLKIMASRVEPPHPETGVVVMTVAPYEPPRSPISLVVETTPFIPSHVVNEGVKPTSYSEYRAATQKAVQNGHWDSVLVSTDGYVLEAGRANIFVLVGGRWLTPPDGVVQGTVRQHLIEMGLVTTEPISLDVMLTSSAIFVSNSLILLKTVGEVLVPSSGYQWRPSDPISQEQLVQTLCDQLVVRLNEIPSSFPS